MGWSKLSVEDYAPPAQDKLRKHLANGRRSFGKSLQDSHRELQEVSALVSGSLRGFSRLAPVRYLILLTGTNGRCLMEELKSRVTTNSNLNILKSASWIG